MKTHPVLRHLLALISASALSISTPSSFGQVKPPPEPKASIPATGSTLTMDVDFRDATVAEVIEFLTEKDEALNVVVQQDVKPIKVSLKLRNVFANQVLNALPFASEGGVDIEDLADGIVGVKANMSPQAFDSDGRPIRPECRIYSLAAYLAGKDEKAAATAIEQFHQSLDAAVQMLNQASPQSAVKIPQLQVNPETKLLIAVGMPDDLVVVEQLVGALQGNAGAPMSGYRRGAGAPTALPIGGMSGALSPQRVAPSLIGIPGIAPGQEVPNSTPKAPGAGNAPQPVPTLPTPKTR